jgi:hypothetical protein
MRGKYTGVMVLFAAFLMLCGFFFLKPAQTDAAINPQMSFQGKLTNPDGTNVTDGTYSIRFRIYNDPTADAANTCSANSCKWEETQASVSVSSGNFQVMLGSVTTLPGSVDFNTSALYIGVKVGSDAEMTPRIQLAAAPYAFNADEVDGLDATNLVQLAQGVQTDSSTTNASIFVNKTGTTADILNLQRGGADVLLVKNDGSTIVKSQTNSSTAFQVQNSSGIPVLMVDTTTAGSTNLITNPGFEINTTGWGVAGTGTSQARNTTVSNTYFGSASYQVGTATSGSTVVTVNSFTSAVPIGTYTFSFYAKGSVSLAGLAISFGSGTCTPNIASIGTTSFQRYYCTVTTTGTTSAITVTTTTTGATLYLDAVKLESGSLATPYGIGAVQIRGIINNPVSIQPVTDSSTAFQVANAAGATLLSVDSESTGDPLTIQIGASTTDATQVLLQLDSLNTFADTATCSTTNNQGAMYYNTYAATVRGCINGSWEDLASTSGLGILAFGVVPDSANAGTVGDIAGASNYSNSPCKVVWTATQQVTVEPCVAYSGGRRLVIPSTALSTTGIAINTFMNVCISTAAGAATTTGLPVLLTGSTTETSAVVPTFSANNPVLCLATVKTSGTLGNVGFIWDTRTFTNTQKQFVSINSVNSNGYLVIGTTTLGTVQTTATGATGPLRGVVVATTGTALSNTVNGIIATVGPAFVKFLSGGTATINNNLQTTTTAGYGTSAAFVAGNTTNYAMGGLLMSSISTSCASTNTVLTACQYSPLVDFRPSR